MDEIAPPSLIPLVEQHHPRAVLLSHLHFGPAHAELVVPLHAVDALGSMDCQCVTRFTLSGLAGGVTYEAWVTGLRRL